MLIVHATGHSLVRFTPSRIACYWGRYTQHKGVGVCVNRAGGWRQHREPLNPEGTFYARGRKKELQELCDKADVIHCHDDTYPTRLARPSQGQAMVYHAHIGDIPRRMFKSNRYRYHAHVKHACITNGYGHLFDEEEARSKVRWGRLPDILDLDHPTYAPNWDARARNKNFTVTFTYSNRHAAGRKINAKCPAQTAEVLTPLASDGININMVTGVAFEESMEVKKRAHIVLDEIYSPYTHLSVLEGAAVGACVLTNYNDYTRDDLCDSVGAPRDSYPFVHVTPSTVVETIRELRSKPGEVERLGRAAYDWMQKWYRPERLLGIYERFYSEF